MNITYKQLTYFFNNFPITITSFEEIIEYTEKNMAQFAHDLKLGCLEIKINYPSSIYETPKKNRFITLYKNSEGYSDECTTYTFPPYLNRNIEFYLYPLKNYSWNNPEKEWLSLFINTLETHFSRSWLSKLIDSAYFTDPMTGTSNTLGLSSFLKKLYNQQELANYTLVAFNIKNFRYINQHFGASNANIIMRNYAQRMNNYVLSNELFCRLGCDNFAVVIKTERLERFIEYSSCVRLHIDMSDSINTFDICARRGVYTIFPDDTSETVMTNTTIVLNTINQAPRQDLTYFTPDILAKLIHDKEISEDFSRAINLNEFRIHFQPKVNLDTNTLCGCEALVRWNKNGKEISPDEFIPVFERDGTICILDFYVLECVCKYIREWLDSGITPLKTSINFSKVHLHNRRLADDIINTIKRFNISPEYIEIEITEKCLYEDYEIMSSFINTMNAYGISTAIDDFGTGYCSLNLLSTLNINVIKLDTSYIKNNLLSILDEQSSKLTPKAAVIKSLISLANDLGMQVACEGIESCAQANFVKNLGCHIVQGFLYDEPLSLELYTDKLKKYSH